MSTYKGIETKENEAYCVSMATGAGQPGPAHLQQADIDDTLIDRNPCYVTTQNIEVVDNECYDCVPRDQPTDQGYYVYEQV